MHASQRSHFQTSRHIKVSYISHENYGTLKFQNNLGGYRVCMMEDTQVFNTQARGFTNSKMIQQKRNHLKGNPGLH